MSTRNRVGLSLIELMATLMILGVLAAIVVPRLTGGIADAKGSSCSVHKGVIEVQATMWKRANGSWPDTDLKNIGADKTYFPEGLPSCPLDNSEYRIDSNTGRVVGHSH